MAGNVTDNYKLELSRLINEYKLKDNVILLVIVKI